MFTRNTLRCALKAEVADDDGALVRLRQGLVSLREVDKALSTEERRGSPAVTHVFEALRQLESTGTRGRTRAEVEARLNANGFRYSSRTVRDALTRLTRVLDGGVVRDVRYRYRLRTAVEVTPLPGRRSTM